MTSAAWNLFNKLRSNPKMMSPVKLKDKFKCVILLLVFCLTFVGAAQTLQAVPAGKYAHGEILIQPEELKILIEKKHPRIQVIDVRENLHYLMGHIPGAVQLWRPDIEDKTHPLPGMMASRDQVQDFMGSLGINDQDTLIIYSYSDGPDHARLWWILAYYGFPLKQMKLLDGGIDAWKAKGYPLDLTPPRIEKKTFKTEEKAGLKPLLCTLPEVRSALKEFGRVVLDVRSKKEYLGEETKKGAQRPGRIPGVTWIEWKETIVDQGPGKGYWKPAEEIKNIFSFKEVTPNKDIYIY